MYVTVNMFNARRVFSSLHQLAEVEKFYIKNNNMRNDKVILTAKKNNKMDFSWSLNAVDCENKNV